MNAIAMYRVDRPACGPFVELTELSMLFPAPEAIQLEKRARARGLSVGQLVRSVISDYLCVIPEPEAV